MNAEPDINFQPPVPSVSITNMVNVRAAVIDRYERALSLLDEASDLATAAHLGTPTIEFYDVNDGYRERRNGDDMRRLILRAVDRAAWAYLMNESGLRTLMDTKARAQWNDNLHKGDIPPLTPENVEATFTSLHLNRQMMFERGVVECFRGLSWDYKTNQPFKFGKRIILTYLFSRYGNQKDRWLSLNHDTPNKLDDLVRIFAVVDGKPEPDHRQGMYSLLCHAQTAKQFELETEYFHIRWFWKGTGHVTFKRPDLVDRLNEIIARHFPAALPDGRVNRQRGR